MVSTEAMHPIPVYLGKSHGWGLREGPPSPGPGRRGWYRRRGGGQGREGRGDREEDIYRGGRGGEGRIGEGGEEVDGGE